MRLRHKDARQRIVLNEAQLREAEAKYLAGATLHEAVAPYGISHVRLGTHLRHRGNKVRGGSPTEAEIDQMIRRYERGESLAGIGRALDYQPDTVRNRLMKRGVQSRDTHARTR